MIVADERIRVKIYYEYKIKTILAMKYSFFVCCFCDFLVFSPNPNVLRSEEENGRSRSPKKMLL